MSNRRLIGKSSVLVVSLTLVVSMITSTAMTGNYAVAQSNSTSNMSSSSVTNVSSSTQANSPYKFERGYPVAATAERAYNDTDLARAIEAYKYFYPTMSVETMFQDFSVTDKPNQAAAKFSAGPRHEFLTGNGDTAYATGALDLKVDGPK